ncbi:hypothetical protein MNBD_NITROSPINAE01-637 [hydrothermal vent metagenome]|uniref:Nitrite/sulphite reductase 4Fe-4S domain-containing protein n=1 Tax=hydrothermal vent metagenome TaxID=652676 RepID=A0A3B1BNM8_9ZZZZ
MNNENKPKSHKKRTYAPHIEAGVISVKEMKKLIAAVEADGAKNIKLSGEIIFVWDEGHGPGTQIEKQTSYEANDFRFGGVRPVKICSAETFCQRFQQPVLGLARKLDQMFYRRPLATKVIVGIAGCKRSCSEPATKDVGIIGMAEGYEILVGGSAGYSPKIAKSIGMFPTQKKVIETVEKIMNYADKHCKKTERLGAVIEKVGMESFLKEIL